MRAGNALVAVAALVTLLNAAAMPSRPGADALAACRGPDAGAGLTRLLDVFTHAGGDGLAWGSHATAGRCVLPAPGTRLAGLWLDPPTARP